MPERPAKNAICHDFVYRLDTCQSEIYRNLHDERIPNQPRSRRAAGMRPAACIGSTPRAGAAIGGCPQPPAPTGVGGFRAASWHRVFFSSRASQSENAPQTMALKMEPKKPDTLYPPPKTRFDECYKLLFGHRETVRDLIVGFIARGVSDRIDLATLERVPADAMNPDLKRRQGDQIWRVRFRDSEQCLVMVLEFQSTPDNRMMLRMYRYVGLAQEEISLHPEAYGLSDGPPVLLPVVLFRGERTWPKEHHPIRLPRLDREIPVWEERIEYSARYRYFLIDFQSISLAELLTDNLVSCIIALERRKLPRAQVRKWVRRLTARLRFFGDPALTEAYVSWAKEVLFMVDEINANLPPLEQLKEMEEQFLDWSDPEWARKWIDAGLKKGREEGIEKGRAEVLGAIRQNLYHQAGSKFDPKTAKQLARRLDRISDPDLLLKISWQIQEGTTSASLFKCLKTRA